MLLRILSKTHSITKHKLTKLNIRWCGSMAEQLIRNEQVAGSIPVTSSKQNSPQPFRMGTVLLVEFCLHYSISFLH